MTATLAPYRDSSLSPDERVADLLSRMTLEEKLAQLGSVWGFQLAPEGRLDRDRMVALLADGLGEVTRVAGSTNLMVADVVRTSNEIQRFLVEETRLGIPAIIHEETLHGLLARDAPVFQQSIGAAATFDPDLVAAVAATIRRRMRATGARHALGPVLDIARDPRWGRIEETYGEDPYLAAAMGVAYVRGLQGPTRDGVLATGKHLVGHGLAEGGLNMAPVHVGWRELRDEQLLPFEAAIREADLATVMPAYCEVDGVPCHASVALLAGVLRGEWGFDGLVASDYIGIEHLAELHRLTGDLEDAAVMAIEAGVDLDLPRTVAYGAPLAEAVRKERVDPGLVDAAVARVLRAKVRLGLLDQPYVEQPTAEAMAALAAEERRVGRELADRSIVLLENRGVLPLGAAPGRIAVLGPLADSARDLLGDYSHALHIETLLETRKQAVFGIEAHAALSLEDELAGRPTILDAFRTRYPDAVRHEPGAGLRDGSDAALAAAVAAARESDIAIVVLGERSGLGEDATTGEFRDRRGLGLLGRQQELLEAIVATGTPVVLVVVSGRPLALEWAAQHCAAVVLAWVPGDHGPEAIVDVLSGEVGPGGKLPVSMPRDVGQVPLHYRHHPSGGRSNPRGDHVDGTAGPLWPFGFGRTYTRFELSGLMLEPRSVSTEGGCLAVSATVANVGSRPGDEVVQVYVRDEHAQLARPVLELAGFARVRLDPGQSRRVTFTLHAEQLAYTGVDYRRIVEPGEVSVYVGSSSADLPLASCFELVGPTVHVHARRRFLSRVEVA